MTKEASLGVRRLRQAIANQATCGSGQLELSIDSADRLCREIEDELARLAWAKGVPAPVDADGEIVPLGVAEMCTDEGKPVTVEEIIFDGVWWYVKCLETSRLRLRRLHLAKPDSWERLEEDARKTTCEYFGRDVNTCDTCPARYVNCVDGLIQDVIRRAKALAERDAKGVGRG